MQKFSAFVLTHNHAWILHINLQNKKLNKGARAKKTTGEAIKGIAKNLLLIR